MKIATAEKIFAAAYIQTQKKMKEIGMNTSHLWNDLPLETRERLMPYEIEAHIRHIQQAKSIAVKAHTAHMKELCRLIANLKSDLRKYNSK